MWDKFGKTAATSLIAAMMLLVPASQSQGAEAPSPVSIRVKDIARLQGVRSNQLNGMGLVIGLNGTGDGSKVNAQLVANTLAKWGITVNVADLKVKNIAAASFPPCLKPAQSPQCWPLPAS